MKKVVWSLFDGSGIMGMPWAENGCEVYCFNADSGNHGEYVVKMKHQNIHYVNIWIDSNFINNVMAMGIPCPDIVFGFPDCTMFAQSGAKHERDDEAMKYAMSCARVVKEAGDEFGVPWMIENPVGKMSSQDNLGRPSFYFHPCDFGGYVGHDEVYHPRMPPHNAYNKKTCIWCGNGFAKPETRPVESIGFFWGWKFLGGKSSETKQLRSLTPEGFARAVFIANFK